jgi:EmrB/QacA subfamily drug resistance transporter
MRGHPVEGGASGGYRWGSPVARRTLAAAVLGSGIAFLDGTVVNVALPAIGDDLGSDLAGLQWVLDGYLVTLTALILLGGALGDRVGRLRIFLLGLYLFTGASVLCALAPGTWELVGARALQGVGGALLVPGSLALLSATLHPDDRGRAVGAWSGLTGVATAVGPFVGGWLVDAASWRWVVLVNVPLAAVVAFVCRGLPDTVDPDAPRHLDVAGALLAGSGLALVAAGLIEGGDGTGWWTAAAVVGVLLLAAFVVVELRSPAPMLPPRLFSSSQFVGANLVTLSVYAGLGVSFFLAVVNLQLALDYSALEAGAALFPSTALMLVLSSRFGALAQRIGPRIPLTVGPLIVAAGLAWLATVDPGDGYLTAVLPGATLFGLGLSVTVAPLTAAVLAAVDDRHLGVGSATNNAVARLAGLLAVAVLPGLAGVELSATAEGLPGYRTAMLLAAGLCVAGAVAGATTIRAGSDAVPPGPSNLLQPCKEAEVGGHAGG